MTDYEDVDYTVEGTTAVITINRPERYNAFRGRTVEELIRAFRAAWADRAVHAVILTGAGEKAFCTGGDVKQRAETGDYGPTESGMFEIGYLHKLIRDIPKPVIAAVNGVAVGGGHVLHVLCDLSIASETARFGQAGPKVGSFDAGFGSAYLARVVGEKRAREIWYLCRLYDAATAERWGLVNAVVPADRLMDEAKAWAAEIAAKSPTALRFLKQSFNADTDHQAGLSNLAMSALDLFTASPEGAGGRHGVRREAPAGLRRARRGALAAEGEVMDFALTPTQVEFRDRARAVAEKLAPDYQARERAGRIDPELRREIGAAGLIAPELPVELGGQGVDRLTSGIVAEEIGRGDINVAYLQVVGSLVGQIVAANAAPEVAAHWVPKICSGEEIVGIGLTEPHAGSDAGMPRLTAVRDGDDWVLNGSKSLSFGRDAAAVVVFARTGPSPRRGQGHQRLPRAARPARRHPRAGTGHGHEGRRPRAGAPDGRPRSPATTCSASRAAGSPRSCRASTSAAR